MMQFFKNNKTPILAAILGVLALAGFYFIWGGSGSSSNLLSSPAVPSSESQQLLATLGDLHAVTLDPGIFKNSTFVSLMDFGTVIPTQAVGRHNPFAPTGAAPSGAKSSSSSAGKGAAASSTPSSGR